MEDKIKAPARTLSRGEKRKLSVGIALISGSKVHVLHNHNRQSQTWALSKNYAYT